MIERQPELVLSGLKFAESPRWFDHQLWLSDLISHRVIAMTSDGNVRTVAEFDDNPSGLGFLSDGNVLVALMRSRKIIKVDPLTGSQTVHSDLSELPGDTLNDLVVDSRGIAYLDSNMRSRDEEPSANDFLLMVDEDGSASVAAEGVGRPNGMSISESGTSLVLAETLMHRLTEFDLNANGTIADRRLFANTGSAFPDGICRDADDGIWFGSPYTSEFLRVIRGGEVTDRIATPGRWAVACVLGGYDRRTLYLVTAVTTLEGVKRRGESEGAIESVQVEIPGCGNP